MDWSGSSTAGAPGVLKRGLALLPREEGGACADAALCFGAAMAQTAPLQHLEGNACHASRAAAAQACIKFNGLVAIKVVKLYRSVSVPQLKPLLALHLASIEQLVWL